MLVHTTRPPAGLTVNRSNSQQHNRSVDVHQQRDTALLAWSVSQHGHRGVSTWQAARPIVRQEGTTTKGEPPAGTVRHAPLPTSSVSGQGSSSQLRCMTVSMMVVLVTQTTTKPPTLPSRWRGGSSKRTPYRRLLAPPFQTPPWQPCSPICGAHAPAPAHAAPAPGESNC